MASTEESTKPNSLVAVLLLTRSRPGPKLVFHYPPSPQPIPQHGGRGSGNESDELDEDAISTNIPSALQSKFAKTSGQLKSNGLTSQRLNEDLKSSNGLFGYSEDSLEKLLSPGCWSDRKKFEVCLDGVTFIGHPIHADHDGSWVRKHTHVDASAFPKVDAGHPTTASKPVRFDEDKPKETSHPSFDVTVTEPKTPAKAVTDFSHVPESLDSKAGQSFGTSMNSGSTTSATTPEILTSFHVVFVLSRSNLAARDVEIPGIYHHVVKPLSKALRYCQKESSYLGIESKKLLALKTKAKDESLSSNQLSSQMLESSELASALQQVYEKISIGGIAGIRLNGMELSLKIPSQDNTVTEVDRHAAILLLEDKDKLLRELAHPDASPLAYFIREHTPAKSLYKHATKLAMPLDSILYLAQHLIKWRKARAIAPLHPRNIYIVGREAPLDHLESHIAEYAQLFSALPSLPQMLKILSGRPIKYGMLIPSRDHREPYMAILAYLVRNRFVEQLKTSGWLQAPPTPPKTSLAEKLEPNKNKRPLSVTSLLSPQMRPVSDDDSVSVSSERTAIPLSIAETLKTRESTRPPTSQGTNGREGDGKPLPRIIAEPSNPSAEDTLCMQHIRDSVDDDELRHRMPGLLQYFDGEAVFEDVAAREGLKRSKFEAWLDLLQEDGFLLTFRHL